MRRMLFFLFFVTTMAVWCTPSFAVQSVVGSGSVSGVNPGAAGTGVLEGVAMSGGVGTLTVGTQDIYTANSSGGNVGDASLSAVSTTASAVSSINFTGNSTVYGRISGVTGDEKTFVLITAGSSGNTVNFLGRVNTTDLSIGTGTVNFKSGSGIANNNNARMNITGVGGTVGIAANTTVIGALTTTAGDGTGTLSLASGSQLTGDVGNGAAKIHTINVVGGTNTAGVNAGITGAVYTHEFSLLTNTLAIDGAFTIATAGTFNTTLAGTSLSQYGHITATGAANIGTGIGVNVTVPSGTYIPLGTLFDIVNATGAISPNIVPTITTVGVSNPLYTFVVEPITGTAAGKLTLKTTGNPIKPATPSTNSTAPMAAAVADALLTLPVTSPVVLAINNLTTADAVANAEAQLAPSTSSLAAPLVTYQGIREFQDLWLSRLDGCGQVSWPSEDKENCKGQDARSGWWLKGFGYFGEQDARGAFTQYNSTIIGSMLAYDVPVGLNTRAGVGFGYARTAIKGSTFDARTDFDTYQGLAYIGHEAGPWFVDGSASFGWNQYQDNRHIQFPGIDLTARSKYNGQDYTAFGRTGYHFPIQKFTLTPMASLQYSRVNVDGHTEREAGDVNMVVKSQHYDYLESGLGAKVERSFTFRRLTFVPDVHLEWLHMLSNPSLSQTAAYTAGSSSFTTPGLKTVADSYHVGTGVTLLSCSCSATTWSVEGGYDYYWRTDGYAANQVTMRVSMLF